MPEFEQQLQQVALQEGAIFGMIDGQKPFIQVRSEFMNAFDFDARRLREDELEAIDRLLVGYINIFNACD